MSDEKKTETFEHIKTMKHASQIAAVAAVSALPKDASDEFYKRLHDRGGAMDVEFTINGFSLPFSAFMARLEEQYDSEVRDAAAKMIVGKATELQRKIERLDAVMRSVEGEVRDAVREEFPGADLTDRE